jgi:predicted SprT family Zn-dependent metalloprotease
MVTVPRTWKICNNDNLYSYYEAICNEAIDNGFMDTVPPLYLFKSTRTWGKCIYSNGEAAIGLNEVYCQDPQKAINTIVHEIGHAATPGHHHDYVWKQTSDKLGNIFGEKVKRTTSQAERGLSLNRPDPEYKYIVECTKCHNQYRWQRKPKCVDRLDAYRCSRCKASLVRVK